MCLTACSAFMAPKDFAVYVGSSKSGISPGVLSSSVYILAQTTSYNLPRLFSNLKKNNWNILQSQKAALKIRLWTLWRLGGRWWWNRRWRRDNSFPSTLRRQWNNYFSTPGGNETNPFLLLSASTPVSNGKEDIPMQTTQHEKSGLSKPPSYAEMSFGTATLSEQAWLAVKDLFPDMSSSKLEVSCNSKGRLQVKMAKNCITWWP